MQFIKVWLSLDSHDSFSCFSRLAIVCFFSALQTDVSFLLYVQVCIHKNFFLIFLFLFSSLCLCSSMVVVYGCCMLIKFHVHNLVFHTHTHTNFVLSLFFHYCYPHFRNGILVYTIFISYFLFLIFFFNFFFQDVVGGSATAWVRQSCENLHFFFFF